MATTRFILRNIMSYMTDLDCLYMLPALKVLYLCHKLLFRNLHQLHLPSVAIAVVRQVLAGQLPQDEQEDLVVVSLVAEVRGKGLNAGRADCERLMKGNMTNVESMHRRPTSIPPPPPLPTSISSQPRLTLPTSIPPLPLPTLIPPPTSIPPPSYFNPPTTPPSPPQPPLHFHPSAPLPSLPLPPQYSISIQPLPSSLSL